MIFISALHNVFHATADDSWKTIYEAGKHPRYYATYKAEWPIKDQPIVPEFKNLLSNDWYNYCPGVIQNRLIGDLTMGLSRMISTTMSELSKFIAEQVNKAQRKLQKMKLLH